MQNLYYLECLLAGKIEPSQRGGRGTSAWEERPVDGVVAAARGNDDVVEADASMPGVIPRQDGAFEGSVERKTAIESQPVALAHGKTCEDSKANHRNGKTLVNGDYEHVNGHYTNGFGTALTDADRRISDAFGNGLDELPPEIEHITFGYIPFSLLVSRLVQQTFNGLTNVINDISDMQASPSVHMPPLAHANQQVNGNGNIKESEANVQKKLRMLNYVSDRRAQFIKILILLRWARQAGAVGKVIDLNVWTRNRLGDYDACIWWMGELKRRLAPLRAPNPDIKTALEVLSDGKVSWLPDHGYLPPETLSPQQLLRTLRKINTLLSIRLSLHESIPLPFKQYTIADGRATFRVPDEFEVDLSIAEEDPTSQLYFIDFRFIFSPTPAELPAGGLRDVVENRANEILKREGLQGLFDSLHNFTLTHKLNVLRNQAFEMARGTWSEQLIVEAVHRSIVVQYWSSRPGGKNWIEIGIKRGTAPASSHTLTMQRMPHIASRWFRSGKEIYDIPLTMKLGGLSLWDTLRQVIALHTSYIFEQTAAKLRECSLYSGHYLRLKSNFSATEPMNASLMTQITALKAIKVVQESVTGRFSILPASQMNVRAEAELNRLASPAAEAAPQLALLRSFASQEEVETGARSMGWEPVRSLLPNQETIERLFVKGIQRTKFYRRSSWSANWILAFTTSLDGDLWWIVELVEKEKTSGSMAGTVAQAAYRIALSGLDNHVWDNSYKTLVDVERTAAGMISQLVDTRALRPYIPHKIQMSRRETAGSRLGSLLIRFPSRDSPFAAHQSTTVAFPQLEEVVRLTYRGLDPSKGSATHVAQVYMQQSVSKNQGLLSTIPSTTFVPGIDARHDALKFQIFNKVGMTSIPTLRDRLKAISILLSFAYTIKHHGLAYETTSLTRLSFKYSNTGGPLKASILFPENETKHVSLVKPNPHLRISDHLSENLRSQKTLDPVIGTLRITLPLLRTLSTIESHQQSGGIDILTRSDQWYQVRYSDPFEKASFEIYLRYKRDVPKWFVSEDTIKKSDTADANFLECLRAVTRGRGVGWRGVKGGIFADIKGVEDLVLKLDEVLRTSKHVPAESNERKRKAEDEIVEID